MKRTSSTPGPKPKPEGRRRAIAFKARHDVYQYFMSLPKGERSQWVNETLAHMLPREVKSWPRETEK